VLAEVKHLVRMGVSVILLHEKSKRPIGDDWSRKPRLTFEQLKAKYRDGMNLGIRLGEWSEIDGMYLHAIDMDIRDEGREGEAIEELERLFDGVDVWALPSVQSGSGGASRHFYFVTDKPFQGKKIAKSEDKMPGTGSYAWEIEIFGTGKQVVAPPSIHPVTERPYKWIEGVDPVDGFPHINASLIEELINPSSEEGGYGTEKLGCTYEEAEAAIKDLDFDYWCDDREGWIRLGMALHHEFDGEKEAFEVWCDYSKQSAKFDRAIQWQQWKSFDRGNPDKPVRMATVFKAAREARRQREYEGYADEFEDEFEDEIEDDEPEITATADDFEDEDGGEAPKPPKIDVPDHLLRVPGVLQLAVDYYNATAEKPQPQFAVQAALALGSTVLGRNWKTNKRNFATLYFLNVAPTGAGKEHSKTVIEEILEASGLGKRIAPSEFTSGAGILSALVEEPISIHIVDEFGIYLATTRDSSSSLKRETQKFIMEAFGRLHGTMRPTGYSMAKMTKEQIEFLKNRKVVRPAMTMLGMTTPETFHEALSGKEVASGFLNRFIIVRSNLGRQLSREEEAREEVPRDLIKWIKEHANAHGGGEEDDDQIIIDSNHAPEPVLVPFDEECLRELREYEKLLIKRMNAMDKENGMASLHIRTREIAMRLALIVAVSCGSRTIRMKHLKWAWDYVSYYHGQMIEDFAANLGKTDMEDVCDAVAELINRAGEKGLTIREISRRCRPFKRMSTRETDEVINRLKRDGAIKFVEVGTGGRKRPAYVSTKR